MDVPALHELLRAIKDAVSGGRRKDDDVALPIFDPTSSDLGVESWCNNIESPSKEFGWSSIATAAKAGKALKGSALIFWKSFKKQFYIILNRRTPTVNVLGKKN